MSHFSTLSGVKFTDLGALQDALKEMGIDSKHILVAEPGKKITAKGWGSATTHADVVVKHDALDCTTDICFMRQSDGSYQMTSDRYDTRRSKMTTGQQAVEERISQGYAAAKIYKDARARGFQVQQERQEDGTVKMVLTRWK